MSRFPGAMAMCLIFAGPAMADSDLQSTKDCLVVHDISSFSQGGRQNVQNGEMSVIATTFENGQWRVGFKGLCPYHLNSHFVYEHWQLGRCLKQGDALQIAGGGACFVENVQQVHSDLPPGPGQGRHGTYK